jgi:phosphatidylethanolamine/phosphatidyl-N-methylethanolamine N-methyltransferase
MAEIEAHESKLYSEFAMLYDKIFAKIFCSRQRHVINTLSIPPGAKVLELGVGTGTSFPAYPRHCEVVGIDPAPHMLARAGAKVLKNGWTHLKVLEMDALDLEFPDNSFDYVLAFHVVTVVPDPSRMMEEDRRVCRTGGRIVIVNHFTSEFPFLGSLTEALDPLTRRLGWRTNLRLKPFVQATELNIEKIYKLSKFSLYTVVVGYNSKDVYQG